MIAAVMALFGTWLLEVSRILLRTSSRTHSQEDKAGKVSARNCSTAIYYPSLTYPLSATQLIRRTSHSGQPGVPHVF